MYLFSSIFHGINWSQCPQWWWNRLTFFVCVARIIGWQFSNCLANMKTYLMFCKKLSLAVLTQSYLFTFYILFIHVFEAKTEVSSIFLAWYNKMLDNSAFVEAEQEFFFFLIFFQIYTDSNFFYSINYLFSQRKQDIGCAIWIWCLIQRFEKYLRLGLR